MIDNATFSKIVRRMLGLSLHGWEDVMTATLVLAGVFALLAGVSTWVVVKLQREEIAKSISDLDRYKTDTGEKIAKANERAALLEKEAAVLRLELNREIEKHRQRLLTDAQKERMTSELRGKLSEVAIVTQNDPEAFAFFVQLVAVFGEAGVKMYAPQAPREDKWFAPAGLMMYSPAGKNEEGLKASNDPLYLALKRANLFGGIVGLPFVSGQPRFPVPELIQGYEGSVLYIGQKSPF